MEEGETGFQGTSSNLPLLQHKQHKITKADKAEIQRVIGKKEEKEKENLYELLAVLFN